MVGSALHLKTKRRPPRWRSAERLHVDLLGHNGGPPLETASSWTGFCWRKAVKAARRPPSREILAIRQRRAATLGLDYRTYAAILADAGVTPSTLVFALTRDWVDHGPSGPRLHDDGGLALAEGCEARLAGLTGPALAVVALAGGGGPAAAATRTAISRTAEIGGWRLSAHGAAPAGGPGEIAEWLSTLLRDSELSPRSALLIGSEAAHREVATRARFAGLLSAERFFRLGSAPTPL